MTIYFQFFANLEWIHISVRVNRTRMTRMRRIIADKLLTFNLISRIIPIAQLWKIN